MWNISSAFTLLKSNKQLFQNFSKFWRLAWRGAKRFVLWALPFGSPRRVCRYPPSKSVIRGLDVVDCSFSACLATCMPRHLTSHLSHAYMYKHSFSLLTLVLPSGSNWRPTGVSSQLVQADIMSSYTS